MKPQDREERQVQRIERVCAELRAVALDRGKGLAEVEAKFKGVVSAARRLRNVRSSKYVASNGLVDPPEFENIEHGHQDHPGYGHGV